VADGATFAHPGHDRLRIAAAADRRSGPLPALTSALLAACTECARLHADLIALATALPNAATPRRIRDYTLTAADAERLRQRGLRGWLARIGSSRDGLTRPLAIGFTTLGLAGLLAATIPTVLPLGAGAGAAGAAVAASADATEPVPEGGGGFHQMIGPAGEPASPIDHVPAPTPASSEPPVAVIALSTGFLVVGSGLFVVRRRNARAMP
jgi:hypothetical protein